MNKLLRLLALAVTLLAAHTALAQAVRLVPTANYGATVAPGGTTARVDFAVFDGQGRSRPGAMVRFDQDCTYLQRGEVPPYACVSASVGESLEVVADGFGIVRSPTYQANGAVGNAWLNATLILDGQVLTVPFFFRVGAAPSPVSIVAGNNQQAQVSLPVPTTLTVRVTDDRGRWLLGVPVAFASSCTSSAVPGAADDLPCVRFDSAGGPTDGSGISRAPGSANAIAGAYRVQVLLNAGPPEVQFDLVNVAPQRTATVKTLPGSDVFFRITDAPAACSITFIEPVLDQFAPPRPDKLAIPYGLIGMTLSNCPTGAKVSFQLQHPGAFPEGNRIWSARPEWKPLPSSLNPIEGFWEFAVTDGGEGDTDGLDNGKIELLIGVAFGDPASPDFGDLWWVGPIENGWGISIIQHRDVLFAVIFGYEGAGQPTWFVMSGGTWNATRDTYTGAIYHPRGKPLDQHVAADFAVGAPVGSLALTFYDTMSARAIITLNGVATIKYIKRQFYGVRDERVTGRFGDMWWAGQARNGWGLVLHQQYASLFAVMFTYGADGRPVWFAMPSITRSANDVFEGVAYRTSSSTWPIAYDPQQYLARDAGSFKIQFTNSNTATLDFATDGRPSRFTLSRMPF